MEWVSANQKLPRSFERVWLKTSSGLQSTGYVNNSGQWVINCPKIAAEKPVVTEWRC